jgi:hypothetical protein
LGRVEHTTSLYSELYFLGYTHPDTFSNITTHHVNTNLNFFFDELEARDVPEEWGVGSGE